MQEGPRDGRPPIWVTALKVLGVVVLAACMFGAAWFLAKLGPAPVPALRDKTPPPETPKEALLAEDQSKQLAEKFAQKEQQQQQISPDDLGDLREAIRLHQKFLTLTGVPANLPDDQLLKLQRSLQDHESDPIEQLSRDLEARADQEQSAGHREAAMDLLQQAMDQQKGINQDYKLSKYVNYRRVETMARQYQYLKGLPLADESKADEAAAAAALAQQDWKTAQEKYESAYKLQSQIDHDYADQPYYNFDREQALQSDLLSLTSVDAHDQVLKTLDQARAAAAGGDYARASELFQDAWRQQHALIASYPKSRFADAALLDAIEVERQSADSQPVAAQITAAAAALGDSLRRRDIASAQDAVGRLAQKIEGFRKTYPRSTILPDELDQCVQFLNFKRDQLGDLQKMVYDQLAPVPGQPLTDMYTREVPQALYQAIVGGNPSRHASGANPVDSVTWAEAVDFCRHLSWLLARPVNLPTLDDFRAALGPAGQVDVAKVSWNLENSNGQTQPTAAKAPNSAGFFDLLGNVGEWLQRTPNLDDGQAPVAGGNAQSPGDTLRGAPVAVVAMTDRGKFTGFRFVVNVDDSAPMPEKIALPTASPSPAISGNVSGPEPASTAPAAVSVNSAPTPAAK